MHLYDLPVVEWSDEPTPPSAGPPSLAGVLAALRNLLELAEELRAGSANSSGPVIDEVRDQVRAAADQWRPVRSLNVAAWPMMLEALASLSRTGCDEEWRWLNIVAAIRPLIEHDLQVLQGDGP